MKKTLFLLLAMTLLLTGNVFAQTLINASTYRFNPANSDVVTTTPTELIGFGKDNVASAVTNIGFTFWFAGTSYTQFSVSENGLMKLGSTAISGTDVAKVMTSATTLPKIAPYWCDLATGSNGSVTYQSTGTTPNRILYVNWNVTFPKSTTTAANAFFQVKLYENGSIFFAFKKNITVATNSAGYCMGIGKTISDYASIQAITGPVYYGTSFNNTVAIAGGTNGKQFQFSSDYTAPAFVNLTPIPNSGGTQDRIITSGINDVTPADGTGVSTSGTLIPRIYYKKGISGTYFSSAGVFDPTSSSLQSKWTFTVNHSDLGGVAPGDQIYYYLVAQDQSVAMGHPNISSYPAGVVATDVNTIITPPATPSVYVIGSDLSGIKTVGVGGDFTSLNSTGGLFEQINGGILSGDLTVQIISDLNETGTVKLNAWASSNGPHTISMVPVGNKIITCGSNGLKLNGTIGFTIDGLNDGTNSLTFNNSGSISIGLGASYNTIKHVTINGSNISFNAGTGTFTTNCSNNTIDNCIINGGNPGISFSSFSGLSGTNNSITNNVIKNFASKGIELDRGFSNFTISGNDIYQTSGSSYSYGIYSNSPSSLGTVNIFNNKIHDLTSGISAGSSTSGISYSASGTYNIYNNEISLEANSTNTQADKIYGMLIASAGTSNVYHNSIYIGGTGVIKGNSVGVYRSGSGTLNFKNNAVYNARSGAVVSQYYKNYGFLTTNFTNLFSDYNLVFVDGISSEPFNMGGNPGMSAGTDYANLNEWKTPSRDNNSISADPLFTSTTYLLPLAGSPLIDKAQTIAGYTTDILGITRNASTPTIGAYEIAPPACTNPTSGGVITAVAAICSGETPAELVVTAPSGGTGTLEYNWQFSTDNITFTDFDPVVTTANYTPGALTATTYYKRLARVDCKTDWVGAAESNVVTVTVNQLAGDAGPITGSGSVVLGATPVLAVPYSVDPIANATSYIWSYSGTGVTINGTGKDVTIDFATNASGGTLSVKGSNSCAEGLATTFNILVFKTLNLKVMLQSLWNSTILSMDVCKDADGVTPTFTAPIADTISVELHEGTSYGNIVHQIHGLELNQDGTVLTTGKSFIQIPSALSGSYYLTIKTRSHVETTSALIVSFAGAVIDYDFTTDATQAYGNNQVLLSTGVYGLFNGDVDQDGILTPTDLSLLLQSLNDGVFGYSVYDLNGNGNVTPTDFSILLQSLNDGVMKIIPIP